MVGKTPMIAAGLGALRQVIGGPLGAGAATVGAIVSGGVTNQAVTGYDLGRELAAVLAGGGSGGGLLGGILPGAGPQGGAL